MSPQLSEDSPRRNRRSAKPNAGSLQTCMVLLSAVLMSCGPASVALPPDAGRDGTAGDGGLRDGGSLRADGGQADAGAVTPEDAGPALDGSAALDDAGVADAGPFVGTRGAPLVAEVGTGELAFVATDGRAEIVCGPQGGQHVWLSIRAQNLAAERVDVTVAIQPLDGGAAICGQQLRGLDLLPSASDGSWAEYTGIYCYVDEPSGVTGRTMRIVGYVTDRTGRTGAAAPVRVLLSGPPRDCRLGVDGGAGQ